MKFPGILFALAVALVTAQGALIKRKPVPSVPRIHPNGRAVTPNDWLSDLIAIITGKDVANFLAVINTSLTQLEELVHTAEEQIEDIITGTTPDAQAELRRVIDGALIASMAIIEPILADLGLVLPVINRRRVIIPDDVSLIISIILGKSLEDFLSTIADGYAELEVHLNETLDRLFQVASIVAEGCADRIKAVTGQTLTDAWRVISPILDVFQQLFPRASLSTSRRLALSRIH